MEGIATILSDYFACFDKDRFEITMIADGEKSPEVIERFTRAGVKFLDAPDRKKSLGSYMRFLKQAVNDYDLFYINGSSAMMGFDLMAAKAGGIPVRVVESHSTKTSHMVVEKILRPFFYRSYTDAIACGQKAGEWLFPGREFQLVKNGRSYEKYKYNPEIRRKIRDQLGLKDSTLALGHVGNLNPGKNQSFLIESFQVLHQKHPDSHLYLAGAGASEEDFKNLVHTLGLDDHVTFLGKIDNVEEIIQAMDVMALPSLFEGLPLVVVEWQMAALPVLVSDTVTRECAFTDHIEFMPLEAGAQAWADALWKLARENDRDKESGIVHKQALEAGFDIQNSADLLQDLFARRIEETRK